MGAFRSTRSGVWVVFVKRGTRRNSEKVLETSSNILATATSLHLFWVGLKKRKTTNIKIYIRVKEGKREAQ
jgi:hypothetical protein